jgi:SAM-dependent methyltransferase
MHDSYWRFHRDQFLSLLPDPTGVTLDLGAGEGRLTRDLADRGHRMIAVDAAPAMALAAHEAAPEIPVVVADAAALPLHDDVVDLVVAFMALHDVDDLAGTVAEVARVLRPGGRLCMAVVHPLNSAGRFVGRGPEAPFVIEGSYLDRSRYRDDVERDGLTMTFLSEHRPLSAYATALTDTGMLIERVGEPALPEHDIRRAKDPRWQRVPLFLHIRARLPER